MKITIQMKQGGIWMRMWLLMLVMLVAAPAFAKTWRINIQQADFSAFVSEVAEITGKNFVVDPRINTTVTVISNKELTRDGVYQLFLEVLGVNGISAIPAGNTVKLVQDGAAKQAGVPFVSKGVVKGPTMVTKLLAIDSANPQDLINAVRPLMSASAHLAVVPGLSGLIVSDRADYIAQLEQLIYAMDRSGDDDYEFYQLKETSPNEILELIDQTTSTAAPSTGAQHQSLNVVADSRNNRLILKGGKHSRDRLRQLIAQLDVPSGNQLSGLRVFKLRYATAKDLVPLLQSLVSNDQSVATQAASSPNQSTGTNRQAVNTASPAVNSGNGYTLFADETLNAIVVKANSTVTREIQDAVRQLDVRRPQVLIQAAIMEVSGNNAEQLGVQWAFGNPNSGVGLVNFSNAGTALTELAKGYFSTQAGVLTQVPNVGGAVLGFGESRTSANGNRSFYGAVLQALETNSKANLLSAPYVITMDNKEATLLVGQNVPFITGTTNTTSTGVSNPFTTIERQDVGISIKVTPRIGDGGTVTLDVEQEVSSVSPALTGVTSADIITNKRQITTTVVAEDQQIIALGGLMQNDHTETTSAVPWLSRIPLLGVLFRAKQNKDEKRNLLVFLQPTILNDTNKMNDVTHSNFERLKMLQLALNPKGDVIKMPFSQEPKPTP